MGGYGYRIIIEDGSTTVSRRPWAGMLLVLCVVLVLGLFSAFAFAVSWEGLQMAGGILVVALVMSWFIREYLAATRERLVVEESGVITWVKFGLFRPRRDSIPVEGIMPDAKGNRLLVRGALVRSRHEHDITTFHGRKARVTILASNGPGQKYTILLRLGTVEKSLKELTDSLLDILPESRYEQMQSL